MGFLDSESPRTHTLPQIVWPSSQGRSGPEASRYLPDPSVPECQCEFRPVQNNDKDGRGYDSACHHGQDKAERNSPPWHTIYHCSILNLTWHSIYEGLYHPNDVENCYSAVRQD